MREVIIDRIGLSPENYRAVVLLKEKTSERYLPIWIGNAEANAIAVRVQRVTVERPLSHDLLYSIISKLDARVDSVIINDLKDDTFYGEIVLNAAEGEMEVDCRPSDALALAVRAEVPIFAEDTVLDKAGLLIDEESGQAFPQERAEQQSVSQDELERMSAFTDFIKGLDMDDFGEGGQKGGP